MFNVVPVREGNQCDTIPKQILRMLYTSCNRRMLVPQVPCQMIVTRAPMSSQNGAHAMHCHLVGSPRNPTLIM